MQRYASSQSREYDQGVVEVLKEELETIADFYGIDEIMIQMISSNHTKRLHCLELLAKMFSTKQFEFCYKF